MMIDLEKIKSPAQAFIEGISSVLNLTGGSDEQIERTIHERTDKDAIWSDWAKVGEDIAVAMDKVHDQEYGPKQE